MSYASAGTIEAIDYNNLAWGSDAGGTYVTSSAKKNVAVVWGVGNARFGWGQSTSSIAKASIPAATTATACTGSTITVGDSQTLGVNEAIKFSSAIGGLTAGATYYVYDKPTTNTLRVAATVNATAPIDLTTQSGLSVSVLPVDFSTGSLAQVASADSITAANWNGLILAVNKALYHTGGANVAVTGVSVGTPIAYYSAVSTAVTTVWNNANTGTGTTTDGSALTSTNTVSWANSIGFVYTVDFTSADEMRYFFNAGGKIKLSLTGPAGTGRNADWRTLCTAMGTLIFGYNTTTKSGGSGTPSTLLSTASNGGMWGTHTSGVDREDFLQYSTGSAYTTNYIQVLSKVTGTAGSNGGKGTRLTFTINLVDDDTNIYQPAVASGTVASMVVASPSSGAITAYTPSATGVTKTTDVGDTGAFTQPSGSTSYVTPGTYTFTVPADVTQVSVVCIGSGGTGSSANVGGCGGGLAYQTITVTPGQSLYVLVGNPSAADGALAKSSGVSTTTPIASSTNYILASGGYGAGYVAGATQTAPAAAGGAGIGVGAFAGAVGQSGGSGGPTTWSGGQWGDAGGGGAAGYGGNGGNPGYSYQLTGSQVILRYGAINGGSGGGGSGGETSFFGSQAGGGGGVGIYGIGAGGATDGAGGSGGSAGSVVGGSGLGGSYGGGGSSKNGIGAGGAVRIVWGPGATYPSSAT